MLLVGKNNMCCCQWSCTRQRTRNNTWTSSWSWSSWTSKWRIHRKCWWCVKWDLQKIEPQLLYFINKKIYKFQRKLDMDWTQLIDSRYGLNSTDLQGQRRRGRKRKGKKPHHINNLVRSRYVIVDFIIIGNLVILS